jgi:membrane-associated protease RseP (regulator of RpoE activity)
MKPRNVSRPHTDNKLAPLARLSMAGVLVGLALIVLLYGHAEGDRNTNTQGAGAQPTPTVAGLLAIEWSEPAPVLGVVVDRNLKVIDVESGSAAEKAGVQRGDVLKKLDSTILTSPVVAMNTARQKIQSKPGQKIDVMLQRGGQDILLQVLPAPPVSRGTFDHPAPTPTAVPAHDGYL